MVPIGPVVEVVDEVLVDDEVEVEVVVVVEVVEDVVSPGSVVVVVELVVEVEVDVDVELVVVDEVVIGTKNSIVRGGMTRSRFVQLNSSLSRSFPPDQSSATMSPELSTPPADSSTQSTFDGPVNITLI
jgi:hypothetical protein